ncbi:MAG TPA: PilW family protein [Steroidobacteraceae bacterium]|nr:PilW family protein [Steroidobacteraceae bacterium]
MRRHAGLTLVEVLVAMLLVLAVITGSIAFVTRGRESHRTSESLARLEEALDAAFATLTDEVRLSGYLGLAPPGTPVEGASELGTAERPDLSVSGACGASLALDLDTPLSAANAAFAAATGFAIGCRPSPLGRAVAPADTLVSRHASVETSRGEAGRLQLESTLRAARLAADGSSAYGTDARRHDLESNVFYVSADSTGRRDWPSLRRKRLVGGLRPSFQDEELVSGIGDLQVTLGLDDPADADISVDRWITPGESAGNGVPRALRIELEAWSDVPERGQPNLVRRKRAMRVVELRNSGLHP